MRALQMLRRTEEAVLAATFLAMVALFFVNVAVRSLAPQFSGSVAWIHEAARVMNLFIVFLALGLALERGRHVGIDTFRDRLPVGALKPLRKVIDLMGLLFSLWLVWLAIQMVRFVLSTGQTSPTLGIPMGWIYAAPGLGFVLLALRFALSLTGVIDRWHEKPDAPNPASEDIR